MTSPQPMSPLPHDEEPGGPGHDAGRLAENIVHFVRVLRAAGLPVGPARMLDAVAALRTVGVARRSDWQAALASVIVTRREQRAVFDQAFEVFWRDPALLEKMLATLLPKVGGDAVPPAALSPRVAHALNPGGRRQENAAAPHEVPFSMAAMASDQEKLQTLDFEKMSADEWTATRRIVATLDLPVPSQRLRRWRPSAAGRIDPRATLRAALKNGGDAGLLKHRLHRTATPPIVALCDISGSMHRYTRMLLYLLHALAQREKLSVFLFGTRLTPVTRLLRARDVDDALDAVAQHVPDWSGGTRIGAALDTFNRRWSRRLLAQNAVVLLVTDGLERDPPELLGAAAERLSKSCRRLIWLNPLLRFEGFEPKAAGVRALIAHADLHIPVHNLEALGQLAEALAGHKC
jgi:uncharacterized protein with von Willebrand factor type A (vWA) domain